MDSPAEVKDPYWTAPWFVDAALKIELHPLGAHKDPQVGCCGAWAAQHPDRGVPPAPQGGVVETHGLLIRCS